jgi:hypothetical protein
LPLLRVLVNVTYAIQCSKQGGGTCSVGKPRTFCPPDKNFTALVASSPDKPNFPRYALEIKKKVSVSYGQSVGGMW